MGYWISVLAFAGALLCLRGIKRLNTCYFPERK